MNVILWPLPSLRGIPLSQTVNLAWRGFPNYPPQRCRRIEHDPWLLTLKWCVWLHFLLESHWRLRHNSCSVTLPFEKICELLLPVFAALLNSFLSLSFYFTPQMYPQPLAFLSLFSVLVWLTDLVWKQLSLFASVVMVQKGVTQPNSLQYLMLKNDWISALILRSLVPSVSLPLEHSAWVLPSGCNSQNSLFPSGWSCLPPHLHSYVCLCSHLSCVSSWNVHPCFHQVLALGLTQDSVPSHPFIYLILNFLR